MLEQIEAMLEGATSLGEFRERLLAAFPDIDDAALRDVIADALTAAHAGGRAALEEDSG
jgi:phage gp29-like protein